MPLTPIHQPIRFTDNGKRDVSTQFGALCYRVKDGKLKFLLITSRSAGRWIIPKGWPMDNHTPAEAATREAYEEAGLQGKIYPDAIGIYSYNKEHGSTESPCVVAVFAMRVDTKLKNFPEKEQRKRKWFGRKKAAKLVAEPELAQIILNFSPSQN
ncbi:NUDIX hydrolase [Cochlodiniinecator piscidefendens]|uniref:NUDIX hydrolase n=1 Tax=Cochlodiniinecator piscidefendens TaxID=2715756 RepID=UPI002F41732E